MIAWITPTLRACAGLLLCLSLPAAGDYKPPRMADGKPSLQGTWSNASITRLTRGRDYKDLVISETELAALTDAHPQVVRQRTDDHLQPEDGLLDGSDLAMGRGYNAFWIDPGREFGLVKGTRRSSWIVDPADGQIPFTATGRKQRGQRRAERAEAAGPEARALGERCLISFGGNGGPPMLNTLYNNTYEIVQTPEHLMILVEMVHDARVIPIHAGPAEARRAVSSVPRWLGNSAAWWEGDTLVVETRNWHPEQARQGPIYMSERGKVIERFTRYSAQQILYEFEVDDPIYYTRPWRGEMSFNAVDGPVYEYACHEGNMGIIGILKGARAQERAAGD
ncbi:hypothetical protein ACXYTJ_10405 [Gilvimarinus sp. F26214L]|uniref:hypothetical protein n=1 Tax=Gilvimarinus sp. DZF01 TaxID=3461371 RepID=UPI00404677CA